MCYMKSSHSDRVSGNGSQGKKTLETGMLAEIQWKEMEVYGKLNMDTG